MARAVDINRARDNFLFFAGAVRHDFTECHATGASLPACLFACGFSSSRLCGCVAFLSISCVFRFVFVYLVSDDLPCLCFLPCFSRRSAPPGLDALNYTQRSPVGVAGLITPWNLPLYLLSWKVLLLACLPLLLACLRCCLLACLPLLLPRVQTACACGICYACGMSMYLHVLSPFCMLTNSPLRAGRFALLHLHRAEVPD